MPATITREMIEGSELAISGNLRRKVERVMITGITTTGDPDSEVLWRVITELADIGVALGGALPGHTECLLQNIIVRGFTNNGCLADLLWQTPTFGGGPSSALIYRSRSYMAQQVANAIRLEGTYVPIEILGWNDPDNAEYHVDPDYGEISMLRPMRAITMSELVYGTPTNFDGNEVGRVNLATWRGLDRGFWLITEFETDVSVYSGYYTKSITALSRVVQDWSEVTVLRNKQTGDYIVDNDSVQGVASGAYNYGITQVPGASRVGPYPFIHFPPLFGGLN